MPPSRGGAVEESSIRDLVENCLSTDDLTPLLRLVFSDGSEESGRSNDNDPETGAVGKADSVLPDGQTAVQAIQNCLRNVVAQQDEVILEVCKSNADEIAQCVADMWHMREAVRELGPVMLQSSSALQAAGSALVSSTQARDSLLAVQHNVLSGVEVVAGTRFVLGLCLEVGKLLEQRQLYQALALLERIKRDQLDLLLVLLSGPQSDSSTASPSGSTARPPPSNSAAKGPAGISQEQGKANVASSSTSKSSRVAISQSSSGSQRSSYESLRKFFNNLITQLVEAVEYLAIAEFNGWLVSIRSDARQVGMRAIRKAAIERQLDDDLARECRSVIEQLESGKNPAVEDVASKLVGSQFRRELQSDTIVASSEAARPRVLLKSSTTSRRQREKGAEKPSEPLPLFNLDADIKTLHLGQPQAAMLELMARRRKPVPQQTAPPEPAVAFGGRPHLAVINEKAALASPSSTKSSTVSDQNVGLLDGVDMRGLYRCVQVHQELSSMRQFQDYYLEQRRLQIASDLKPPNKFMETYQSYLSQVLGFFIVESYVVRQVPKLVSHEHALMLWEGAAGSLKSALEAAMDAMRTAPMMVSVKDFTLLVCRALEGCGFTSSPIEDVLLTSRSHYHELLTASTARAVSRALESDELRQYEVRTEREVQEQVRQLGLPSKLVEADGPPLVPLPFRAPYSVSMPTLLTTVCGFVEDSACYLTGLFSPWELVHAVFFHRDKMMSKVLVEAFTKKINMAKGAQSLPLCMKLVTNVWSIIQAMPTLDERTMTQSHPKHAQRGRGLTSATSANMSAKLKAVRDAAMSNLHTSLKSMQELAERAVLQLISVRVDKAMASLYTLPWLSREPFVGITSPYMKDLIALLADVFESARQLMPTSSFLSMCVSVVNPIARAYINLFAKNGPIKAYNLFVIQRFAADLRSMQDFASTCGVAHLEDEFNEPVQLFNLLLLPEGELTANSRPEWRRQLFPVLEVAIITLVLDKYREIAKVGKEPTGFPTKRCVDGLSKALRLQPAGGG